MPDNPRKNIGHRRAHSEILTLPVDIDFDSDLGVVGAGVDGPSLSDETDDELFSMFIDMDKVNLASSATSGFQVWEPLSEEDPSALPRVRHQHSQSMDGSMMINPEMLGSGFEEVSPAEGKKAMSTAKLAELGFIDPKRAKRIWANRQSAARSKERKMRYISELEHKIHLLQNEESSLSAQLAMLKRDSNVLTAENNELKLRLQTIQQQSQLRHALNEHLTEEVQHLKIVTGQGTSNGEPMMNFPTSFGGNQALYANNNQAMHTQLTAQQVQQLQIHSQKQQHQFQQHQQSQHPPLAFKPGTSVAPPKENVSGPRSSASKM